MATIGLILAGLLAGCGLPRTTSPQRVKPANIPYGLLNSAQPSPTSPIEGPRTTVFLVDGDHLLPVARHVVGSNIPAEALRVLLLGPTPAESAHGLTSDVPGETHLVSLDLSGSVANVDLNGSFGAAGGTQQVLAVAQIVYTLTASKYINGVVFSLSGHRIEVPNGTGSLSTAPRTRADYGRVAPRSS